MRERMLKAERTDVFEPPAQPYTAVEFYLDAFRG